MWSRASAFVYRRSLVSIFQSSTSQKNALSTVPQGFLYTNPNKQHFFEKDQPLAVVIGWLLSKKSYLTKYEELYHQRGIPTLTISPSVNHIFSQSVVEKTAHSILQTIESRPGSPVIIHAFSVGAYIYAHILRILESENGRALYPTAYDSICAQVFDSPVDVEGIPLGVAQAISNNPLIQNSIINSLKVLLNNPLIYGKFKGVSNVFYANRNKAPSLWLMGTKDALVPVQVCQKVMGLWQENGIKVKGVYFDGSVHVSHLRNHHVEYKNALDLLLDECLGESGIRPSVENVVNL